LERKPLSFQFNITVTGAVFTSGVSNREGSGTTTTPLNSAIANAGGYIKQVLVKAPFDTATFDFRIENANGFNVFKRTEQVGEISPECEIPLPAGRYSLFLSKCSHDGSYLCELLFAEVY